MASLFIWNCAWQDSLVVSVNSQAQFPVSLTGTVVLPSLNKWKTIKRQKDCTGSSGNLANLVILAIHQLTVYGNLEII
jgi:hypothetical protein